jgi:hypothetical protein
MHFHGIPAILLLVHLLFSTTLAWSGKVTFYKNANFEGLAYEWPVTETQLCYNLSCFDNKASSIKWEGLPAFGQFKRTSRIAFFTGRDCTGESRDWPTDGVINGKKENYPLDLAIDGIDDAISSFVIWEDNKKLTNGKITPCL